MDHMPEHARPTGLIAGFEPLPKTDLTLASGGSITWMPGYRATDMIAYAERQVARALRRAQGLPVDQRTTTA